MDEILRVENLSKTFHVKNSGKKTEEVEAVRDLSFSMRKGEILGLAGESGSGKSTAARLISGLIPADTGHILLDGQEVLPEKGKGKEKREGKKKLRGKIQMVFQNPTGSFDPRRTIGYGIEEGLKNKGFSKKETEEQVDELLMRCGLPTDYANRLPQELSGGECQRAAIARALSTNPVVLICDEATSSLDEKVQDEVVCLLKDFREKQKLSVLFICHNLMLMQTVCDHALVMHEGRIVERGTVDKIINEPENDYTRRLVSAARWLGKEV